MLHHLLQKPIRVQQKFLLIAGILCLLPLSVFTQAKSNQQWLHLFEKIYLPSGWYITGEGAMYMKEEFEQPSLYLFRTSLGKQIHKQFSMSAGFGHLGFYSNSQLKKLEFRPYQEFNFKHQLQFPQISHRVRLEQRFLHQLEKVEGVSRDNFLFRIRYKIKFTIPINSTLKLNVADEVFVHTVKGSNTTHLDQNWIIIGPSVKVNPQLSLFLYYNLRHFALSKPGQYRQDNIIWLGIMHKIKAHK